jgi:hypothetical protein
MQGQLTPSPLTLTDVSAHSGQWRSRPSVPVSGAETVCPASSVPIAPVVGSVKRGF